MSFILSPSTNYSLISLPVYYFFSFIPHGYALHVASNGNVIKNWDNRNSRSGDLQQTLKQRLDSKSFGQYERGKAAHYNALESFPLFAAAVIVANMARVENAELNAFILTTFVLRSAYFLAYINISKQEYTPLRSILWMAQLGWNLRFLWKAGSVFM